MHTPQQQDVAETQMIEYGRRMRRERDAALKALEAAKPVLEYVSRGRRFVDVEKYPDATARRALGMFPEST